MFQFNATTVINGTTDSSGRPLFSTIEKGGSKSAFQIKRFGTFDKECIVNIYQVSPQDGEVSTLVFKVPAFTDLGEGEYQLYFRIVPEDINPAEYAHYSTYPRRNFPIDFVVTRPDEDVTTIAERIKKVFDTYLRHEDGKLEFSFSVVGDTITLKTKTPNFRFENVVLSKYNNSCSVNCGEYSGYEAIARLDVPENFDSATVTYTGKDILTGSSLVKNQTGFGTYDHLLRTVNLPTEANYSFTSRTAFMRPVPGVKYTQFVIDYYKNRGILGHSAVGEDTDSLTQHSIWVAEAIVPSFEAALTELGVEKGADKRWKVITNPDEAAAAVDHVTGPTTAKETTIKEDEEAEDE